MKNSFDCVKVRYGSIHGRFQPFHREHLRYALYAASFCEHLIVGITQYDRLIEDSHSPQHRLDIDENPFSYWQRYRIIECALSTANMKREDFSIVPFPIHDLKKISQFLPSDCVHYTTIVEEWNRNKIERFKSENLQIAILWEESEKPVEGKIIRALLKNCDYTVKDMFAPGTESLILKYFEDVSR